MRVQTKLQPSTIKKMFQFDATFIFMFLFLSVIKCSPLNKSRALISLPLNPENYQYGNLFEFQSLYPSFPDFSQKVSVVAHMANTPDSILWALNQGASGIEFDLNFDGTRPSKFYHGSPCDCTPYTSLNPPSSDHICSFLKNACDVSTSFDDMTNFLGSPQIINLNLAIIYIDSKIDKSIKDYYEAGKNVVKGFNKNVMEKGFRGQIIISCPNVIHSDYLRGAYNEAYKSKYVNQYFYTIDNERDNAQNVLNDMKLLGTANIVYSVGITALLPATYFDAIQFSKNSNVYAGVGIWTLDKESSMADYMKSGVNLIVTNSPKVAVNLVGNLNLSFPGDALTPKALSPILGIPYWNCDCSSYSSVLIGSCRITKRASANYACYCDSLCQAKNVKCDTINQLCRTPNVTLEACKLGGGNCGGY